MSVRIVCRGLASGRMLRSGMLPPLGSFLAAYDPEAHDGQGHSEWTDDPADAMVFPGVAEAHACWTVVSVARPRRPDGRANRPLCAFTVEIQSVPEGK